MKTIKTGHKIIILFMLFTISLVLFYSSAQRRGTSSEESNVEYIAGADIPILYANMLGYKMNAMRGYISPMGSDIAYDTLTLLPEDRKLVLSIEGNRLQISSVSYEVRTVDLTGLIERTEVTDFSGGGTSFDITLPIQNLLAPNTEYRLDLKLSTRNRGDVHYYTRIMLPEEQDMASEMIGTVLAFSDRNFDPERSKENTIYVETDGTADGSTLGYTTLKSTFANISYNELNLTPSPVNDIRLCIYDGNTGEISLRRNAERVFQGKTETYEIEESFSMRMGAARLYMMNYSRYMNEVFDGSQESFTGRRIMLGISEGQGLESISSPDGRYNCFSTGKDLWCFDTAGQEAVCVSSFRVPGSDDIRYTYPMHAVKMLSVTERTADYLLYGYMNRGHHEGENGIVYMSYDFASGQAVEKCFIPVAESFERLKEDVEKLSYLGANSVLYLKLGDDFFGLDTKSGDYQIIASDLTDGMFGISKSTDLLAWQPGGDVYGSDSIHILDLDTGEKKELRADEGSLIRVEGFIGRDMVITMRRMADAWDLNGMIKSVPAYAVEILDDDLNILKLYTKTDTLIDEVVTRDGRVNMSLIRKTGAGSYTVSGEDTLVSSAEAPERSEGIGNYISDDLGRVYYVQLPDDYKRAGNIKVSRIDRVTEEGTHVIGLYEGDAPRYYAYGEGRVIGTYGSVAEAAEIAYDHMGSVRYEGKLIWNRAGTVTSRILSNPEETSASVLGRKAAGELMDLRGLSLRPVLTFVSGRSPVLAYSDKGTALLIYAYDKSFITVYDISRKYSFRIEIGEAEEMFRKGHNEFYCVVSGSIYL